MHEQHTGRAADRAGAMATGADIVGKEHAAAAALALLPVAGFDFESAGKYEKKLASGRPGANPDKGSRACP